MVQKDDQLMLSPMLSVSLVIVLLIRDVGFLDRKRSSQEGTLYERHVALLVPSNARGPFSSHAV